MGGLIVQPDAMAGMGIHPLKTIKDARGFVKHMLRADAPHFNGFGEIYFSFTNQYVIKGWKCHPRFAQNIAVPQGNVLFVIYDPRNTSPSYGKVTELVIGDDHYCLLQLPPGMIYGFQALSAPGALIVNCIDVPYQPDEGLNYPLDSAEIPYQWQSREVMA